MRYLSVLGPIPTDEGDAFTPVVLSDAAPPRMLSPASSLDGALFSARRALGATDDVLADDTLGHLAAQAGLRVGALPEPERLTLAAVAVAVNSHEGLTKVTDARLLHELLTSTVAFTRARPWRRFLNDLTLPGRATGPGGGDFECTVLGEGGEQHGLIAYDARGGHERFLELLDARTPGAAMRVDSVACLVDFSDDFVARAVQAAFGEAVSITLVRFQKGRPQPLRPDDARRLVATLRAVTQVADDGPTGVGASDAGRRVEVTLDVSRFPKAGALPSLDELPASVRAALDAPQAHPAHALDREVTVKLVGFAKAHVPSFVMPPESPTADFEVFLATVLQPFGGRTVLERFLAEGHPTDEERAWLEKKARAQLSLWEVEATAIDGALALVDLLSGRRVVVHDVASAERLRHRDALCAALVDAGDTHLIVASHPRPLFPNHSHDVAHAYAAARPDGAFATARALADAWGAKCDAPFSAGAPGEGPRTTDGEVFAPSTDTWALDKKARKQVEAALDALPGFRRTSAAATEWSWSKRGNAYHPGWWRTALGDVRLEGTTLRISAASTERLDRARALLEAALPGVLRHAGRRSEGLPAGASGLDVRADSQPMPEGPWLGVQRLSQVLGSSSAAATDAEARARIHTQACLLERNEERAAEEVAEGELGQEPVALAFRRITGVAGDGRFVGPDELWLAMGAGFPLSTSLQSTVAPLMFDLAGDAVEQLRDDARVGWAVWNAVRETEDDGQAVQLARRQLGLEGVRAAPTGRKRRPRKSEQLAPELERADNAALMDEALPWAVRQARALAWDRRVIGGLFLEERGRGGFFLQALWTMPPGYDERLRALGYRSGLLPLTVYDGAFDPLEDGFCWRAVAPAWRREVLAQWYRDMNDPFHGDFAAQLDAHVAVLDAVTADTAPGLRDAWRELREDAELDDDDIALALTRGVRNVPALDLRQPGKGFAAALRRLVEAEVADWSER